ncbi:MAG TPA: anti-sigma factor, partial [Pyrinomonadaceae bacterium]|nr:anti-sigma factor [Pyrinomonadaceae bacterium]
MSKGNQLRRAGVRACRCASALAIALACAASFARRADSSLKASSSSSRRAATASRRAAQGGGRVDIRLRSLTTRATGRLTVEASAGGGHARLTALNLPDPETVAAGARTYVVWAVSGGRIVRLGELQRDARGNGGLAFDRPEGLEHYGVIVTAEATADAERPGDPVLSSRADEAAALYPSKTDEGDASKGVGDASKAGGDASKGVGNASVAPPPVPVLSAGARRAGDFYSEVDDALAAGGGGRVLELEGETAAPRARGAARATVRESRAYVRVNFRAVPLPPALGANVYVLWAVTPDSRVVYMGSLPVTDALNTAEIYVRVAGFDADDYALFV